MIGTTRMMSDKTGTEITSLRAAYTAFGERVTGSANRYGYAGKWGYQTDDTEDLSFVHVGTRYYDPSIGRFLQRDPIGIQGGFNVYAYVGARPTLAVDPEGEFILIGIVSGIALGVKAATAYYEYRAAQDAIEAAKPYNSGSNEDTQRELARRKDALRKSAKNIQGVMSCVPGTSLTGPPQPSTDAASGALEAAGGFAGGS